MEKIYYLENIFEWIGFRIIFVLIDVNCLFFNCVNIIKVLIVWYFEVILDNLFLFCVCNNDGVNW